MTTNQTTPTTAEIIFTAGLPAAGKTTYVNKTYDLNVYTVIDPDLVKESHPDYDPADPAALHGWSQDVVEKMWEGCLEKKSGKWIVDGTGTNAEKMVRRINQARDAGYGISLVYVTCSLETSLERNANRDRVVPEYIVRDKARNIQTAFELIAPYADTVEVIDNN